MELADREYWINIYENRTFRTRYEYLNLCQEIYIAHNNFQIRRMEARYPMHFMPWYSPDNFNELNDQEFNDLINYNIWRARVQTMHVTGDVPSSKDMWSVKWLNRQANLRYLDIKVLRGEENMYLQ